MTRAPSEFRLPAWRLRGWHDAARVFRLALVTLLLLAALASLVVSTIGYDALKGYLDPLSLDREADFTLEEYRAMVARLRLFALLSAGAAALLLVFARGFDRLTAGVTVQWWEALTRAPAALRSWIESERVLYLAALTGIIVTAVALRVAFLDVPIRYDEAATFNAYVSSPLYVGLANYSAPNNHLLHTLLAHISVQALGSATWALRLPALVAGVALVPATFAFTRVLYGRAAALLAAALVATSSTLIEYSTNARGYTLVALATLAAFLAATRVLETGSVGAWAALAASGALGFYAIPVMVYAFGGALLWIVVNQMARRESLADLKLGLVGSVAFAGVLAAFAYGPAVVGSGAASVTSNRFVDPDPFADFVRGIPGNVSDTVGTWVRDLPVILALVVVGGLLVSLALTPRISRYPFPAVLAVVAWTLPLLAAQRVVPFTRVWLFLLPVALAACAGFYGWVIERLPGRHAVAEGAAVLALATGAALVLSADTVRTSRETGGLLDGREVARYLETIVGPGDAVVATGSEPILEYYLERDGYDAGTIVWGATRSRVVVLVVNRRGNQTVEDLIRRIPGDPAVGRPKLLAEWPSAQVYRVRVPPRSST